MKITFLVSSLQFGGAERVATTLCNAWVQRGHDVALIATYRGTDPCFFELEPSVQLSYLASKRTGWLTNSSLARLFKLRQLLKQQQPDLVLSFLPSANIMAILASIGLGVPVIVSERTDPEFYPQSWFWRTLCRHLYQCSTTLTVQTEAVAAKVSRLFKNVSNVAVMPNPLPFETTPSTVISDVKRPRLVSLGRLTDGKQTEHLIYTFNQVADAFPDWHLDIFGDGPQREFLESVAAKSPYCSRIEFHGDTKQPWVELANADIFVMTSRFEGFPNALLEALALGVASIVYDCPSGPAEITENGRLAALVPLNDQQALMVALNQLMADQNKRVALGQLAAAVIHEKYGRDKIVERWERLFDDVCHRKDN